MEEQKTLHLSTLEIMELIILATGERNCQFRKNNKEFIQNLITKMAEQLADQSDFEEIHMANHQLNIINLLG